MSSSKDIKLDLNSKVSPEFSCVLIKGIVEYLLYYRHQIPFNFELFEKLIKNKEEEEICFKKLKLLNLAKNTYEGICGIKSVIENELKTARSIYLIFGKTLFTSLEAYEIMLPSHSSKSATNINETAIKRILLQLIQNENLRYKQLSATNIYFLFNRPIDSCSDQLIELRNFKLNRSCHKYRISFRDVSSSSAFEIFQDEFNMLNLSDENQKTEKQLEDDNVEDEEIKCVWYQSKIFVKGFNAIKNDSIWT